MRAIFATMPGGEAAAKGLEDVLQREHTIRHRFAAWQMLQQEAVRISEQHIRQRLRDGPGAPRIDVFQAATAAVLRKKQWLDRADGLKQRGLYVDAHGGSLPSKITRADYDEALSIVEPYVTLTLQQAGLLPKPSRPRHTLFGYSND